MKNALISLVVLVILGAIAYFVLPMLVNAPAEIANQTNDTPLIPEETPTDVAGVTIHYSAAGFSPASVTVNQGTTVTFVSDDGSEMWVATDEHPTHTGYDGTNKDSHCPNTANTVFDQCQRSSSYSFTFNKVGTWNYHNHAEDEDRGTIIVQ